MNVRKVTLATLLIGMLTVGLAPAAWAADSIPVESPAGSRPTVENLRCEYLDNPLGIDVRRPRLSWITESKQRGWLQSAYQILVASSEEKLKRDEGDLWDSGKVPSDRSIHVVYQGKPLTSRMRCYWKVRVWDKHGKKSSWSKPALWTMGLLEPDDWRGARWIGLEIPKGEKTGKETEHTRLPARYLRRDFKVSKPVKSATAYVCGLGEFDFFLNGKKVGDHERDPGRTEFNKRVLYVTFDVKDYLQVGNNAAGAILGNGRFFAPRVKVPVRTKTFGTPRLLLNLRITYEDGTTDDLVSSSQWKATDEGPIRANNEYDGEEYDARMEMPGWNRAGFSATKWRNADLLSAPGGRLQAMVQEPMRVCEVLTPVNVSSPQEGVHVVDFGQYFYGANQISVSCPVGTEIKMVSSGDLHANGRVNLANERSAKCTDTYICKGGGKETWRPRFRGHGHRYVEITGFTGTFTADHIRGLFIHNDVERLGTFESSNTLLNTYDRMMTYDQLGQMRGYPSSEQGRDERQGWLGASGTYIENEAAHLGSANIFSRWLDDVRLDQRADGCIPAVSPSYWVMYNNDVVWPADIVLIPAGIYKYFGDKRVLAVNYPAMKTWMSLIERSILSDGTVNLNAFGDWCDGYSMDGGKTIGATSRPLISTAYVTYLYHLMALSAEALNETTEANAYGTKAEKMKSAFNKRFFDPKSNTYASKTQCANVLPLAFGLVPEANRAAVIENLIHDIEVTHNDHLTVGLVGMGYYMRTLSNIGHADVAYKLTQQTTRPSWGYMVNKGATGMWERWDMDTLGPAMNGQGFKMLAGDLHAFLYQNIAGIAPDIRNPGFKHIILKPEPVDGMTYVNASYKSMYGRIVSNWKRENDTFKWQVTIPPNTTATLYVPAKDTGSVTESGKPTGKADHVRFIRMQNGRAVFEVGSGDYEFRSTIK